MDKLKITVVGMGYVGMSMAVLLGLENVVCCVDVVKDKIDLINKGFSPVKDEYIERYFNERKVKLIATMDLVAAYSSADYVVVACPTNFDSDRNTLDTSIIEKVLEEITTINKNAKIVIKSTVPVGFTQKIRKVLNNNYIFYSPEFLRETQALYDNLYPSRIVVGTEIGNLESMAIANQFADLLAASAKDRNVKKLIVDFSEAEAIKLFSNAYLALRVTFFNEVDTFAETHSLDTKRIIEGICLDHRIGNHYNNPSFGFGGYCLPKDTKQLLANFKDIPEKLIGSIVEANDVRKDFVVDRILIKAGIDNDIVMDSTQQNIDSITIGVYRLVMKNKSDNFRSSSVIDIINRIKERGVNVIIYEPELTDGSLFMNTRVINNILEFKESCTIIIANRYDKILEDFRDIVYTRDLFERD